MKKKKILTVLMAIILVTVSALAFAEGTAFTEVLAEAAFFTVFLVEAGAERLAEGTAFAFLALEAGFAERPLFTAFVQFLTNPITGEAYQIGDAILSPATGKEVEMLLGDRVFFAALIMGVFGFLCFIFMIKKITVRVDENTVKTNEPTEKFNIFQAFGKFMKNRPAVGATVAAMGMFLGMQSATVANTIMFATYFNMASTVWEVKKPTIIAIMRRII